MSKEDKISYNDAIYININNNKEVAPVMTEPIQKRLENLILPHSSYKRKIHHQFDNKQSIPEILEYFILPKSDCKIHQFDLQNDDVLDDSNGANQLDCITTYNANDDDKKTMIMMMNC